MDGAYRSTRRFPGHTTAELEAAVARVPAASNHDAMVAEIAARKAGTSKPFRTPQIAPAFTDEPAHKIQPGSRFDY